MVHKINEAFLILTLAVFFSCLAVPARAAEQLFVPSQWAEEKMNLADEIGLIGSSFAEQPFQAPINRLDFRRLLVKACRINDFSLPELSDSHPFVDTTDAAAERAFLLGLVRGSGDGRFNPDGVLSREMAAVMLTNLGRLFGQGSDDQAQSAAEQLLLSKSGDSSQVSIWAVPSFAWVFSQGILSGGGDGNLDPQQEITREQAVIILLNLLICSDCPELQKDGQPLYLLQPPTVVRSLSGSRTPSLSSRSLEQYGTAEAAAANMVTLQVSVWQMTSSGDKKAGSLSLTVHRDVADDVLGIFTEIFRGSQQFPIRVVSGYSYRSGTSQHSNGTAIDINPTENFFLGRDGGIKAGSFWQPGVNPYSITPDGDVVRAFNRYGWKWSPDMNWSNGADYMHFSLSGN